MTGCPLPVKGEQLWLIVLCSGTRVLHKNTERCHAGRWNPLAPAKMWEELDSFKKDKWGAGTEHILAEKSQPSLERKLWLEFVLLVLLFELQIKARKKASLDYVQHMSTLFRAGGNFDCSTTHINLCTQTSNSSSQDEFHAQRKKAQLQIKKCWWLNYSL